MTAHARARVGTKPRRCSVATSEQALLASLLDEVAEHGQALVLRGEPGIGKSRLLSRRRADGARSRDDGAHGNGRAVRGASAVCRTASAAPPRPRACGRAAADPTGCARRRVRADARGGARALPDRDGRARPRRRTSPAMRRCCWSSRTRTGSTPRPRTCSRSSLGGSSPTRSSCWPPRVTATPRRSTDAGLPEHRLAGLDDATAAALLDAAAPEPPAAAREPRAA